MKTQSFILAALAASPCFAQTSTSPPIELDPIVITATRSEQPGNRLPAAVSVITRQDIEASGASHILQLLRLAGAAQVSDFFGDGSRATVDLRGFGDGAHSTTLILLDGRRLNNSDIASPDLSSVSLKDVERIEIIQGSAGVLYGDQAVGGVINIITRTPQAFELSTEAGGGSYDGLQGRVALGQRKGGWSYRVSAEGRGTGNYRDHNNLEYKNALARVGYDAEAAGAFLELGWIDEDLQTPGALFANEVAQDRRQSTANFSNDFSDTVTGFARANWRQNLAPDWSLQTDLTFRESDGKFRLGSAFGPSTADSTQDRITRSLNPRLVGSFPSRWGASLFTGGVDVQDSDYELASPFGVQHNEQRQLDGYAQAIMPLPAKLEITLGARLATVQNEVRDGFTFVVPTRFHDSRTAGELGLSHRPAKNLRIFARYDRNFRFAKVDEFTNAGAAPGSGIVNIRTQTGDSYEAGVEWDARRLRLSATAYRLVVEDEITFDPTTFANTNLDRTRRYGLITEADWDVAKPLTLGARYHYVDAEVTRGQFAGNDIPLVSRQTAKFFVRSELPRGFSLGTEALAVDERAFAGDFDNTLGKLPGHVVVNLNFGWQIAGLDLDARVNNVLDKEYSEYGAAGFDGTFTERESYFPSPETNFWLSARYDW